MSIKRIDAGNRMSMANVYNGVVYLAGQTAHDTAEDIEGQTKQVLAQIDAMLAKAGTDKSKLLTAQVFISDMVLFNRMNKIWDAWVIQGSAPGRTTVEAKISTPQKLVEITCTAAL
ncbi:MAG: RidA family protein [Alphaproteobacteria bacterium]|nr:RidA family protein [Alphaproteobacteria bacterium]